jgi:hypothetical protein
MMLDRIRMLVKDLSGCIQLRLHLRTRTVVALTREKTKRPTRPGVPRSVGSISQKAAEMVNVDGEFAGTAGAVGRTKSDEGAKTESVLKMFETERSALQTNDIGHTGRHLRDNHSGQHSEQDENSSVHGRVTRRNGWADRLQRFDHLTPIATASVSCSCQLSRIQMYTH